MNIAGWADANLGRHGDYELLDVGDRCWRSTELHDASCRLASAFVALGVAPGGRVLLLLPLGAEVVIAARAAWRAGGVVVVGSADSPMREVEHLIRDCGPTAAVCANRPAVDISMLMRDIRATIVVDAPGATSWLRFDDVIARHQPLRSAVPRAPS